MLGQTVDWCSYRHISLPTIKEISFFIDINMALSSVFIVKSFSLV